MVRPPPSASFHNNPPVHPAVEQRMAIGVKFAVAIAPEAESVQIPPVTAHAALDFLGTRLAGDVLLPVREAVFGHEGAQFVSARSIPKESPSMTPRERLRVRGRENHNLGTRQIPTAPCSPAARYD